MKRWFSIFTVIAVLFSVPFLWAHGDASHVMGTVTEIAEDHVVVTTTKGETASIAIMADTTFQNKGTNSQAVRPQIGDRLVAEVTKKDVPENRDWVATNITFATPTEP